MRTAIRSPSVGIPPHELAPRRRMKVIDAAEGLIALKGVKTPIGG
jgi:hypothetical protein